MQAHSYIKENGIEVREYTAVSSDVLLLASNQLDSTSAVKGNQSIKTNSSEIDIVGNGTAESEENKADLIWVDPGSCCYALYSKLNSEKVLLKQSPLALAKALKVPCLLSIQIKFSKAINKLIQSDLISYLIDIYPLK